MRLLVVCYTLPPALYPQAIQIGRLLAHIGGEIGAVCGSVVGARDLDHDFDLDSRLAFRLEIGFRPRLSGFVATLGRHFVPFYARIPDEFRAWVPLAEVVTINHLARSGFAPDLLVTFGEPMSDHLLGLRLKARFGLPWIAHFSDPWADNRFRRYNWLANIVNRRLERDVIARADRVIFTSQEALDVVIGKYPPSWRDKAAILPHSFDPTLFPPPAPAADEIVVRHVGNFYGHRTPIPLFHALKLILGREPRLLQGVRFELVGHVPLWVRKHPSLRALPAGLVQLTGQVSYLKSLRLMSNSQLLLTIDGPDDLSVFLPSKLIEYLGSGAPIFGIVPPGTSAKLLARCGGLVADPRNPVEVAQALNQTLQLVRERRRSRVRTPWADRKVRSEFHVERVAAAFSELLRDVVREPRKAPAV